MINRSALVITSISEPNKALLAFAKECKEQAINFILIGDVASPPDFKLDGCNFYDMGRQGSLHFKLSKIIPERHYARKNLGYLVAIERGAEVILESDDDNFPMESFCGRKLDSMQEGRFIEDGGWVNVYKYFSDNHIWPRGFPLELLQEKIPPLKPAQKPLHCPIQQGLADENPDVDAVFRLVQSLPQSFAKSKEVILGKNSWCPFNSQNTRWFKEAFSLLYLPSYCSFRMTDIWRSFVAQRICWENDWNILFHEPTVWQERNEHDLMKDFKDEIPGYLNNLKICETLQNLDLKAGFSNIHENLYRCYKSLASLGLTDEKEFHLLDAWINDMERLK